MAITLPGFILYIQFHHHKDHKALHEGYLQQLRPRLAQAVPSINHLNLETIGESSSHPANNPYHLYEPIGSGAYGTVYTAAHSYTGTMVAIKVFRKPESNPLKEAAILRSLSHVCIQLRAPHSLLTLTWQPNIVRFIDFISRGGDPVCW